MSKLIEPFRHWKIKEAEKHFWDVFNSYRLKDWDKMTLEELDNIPTTIMHNKAGDDLETAARMLALADAYWVRYSEHYGSEGTSRGQELQQHAHDLLGEKLGPWNFITKSFLKQLCRWDLNNAQRQRLLEAGLAHMKQRNGDYATSDPYLMQEVVTCCLRNDDYSDNVKALQHLCVERIDMIWSRDLYTVTIYRPLFSIHLRRQEWGEAEKLVSVYLERTFKLEKDVQVELYANLGEVQIRLGKQVDGERTLHMGMAVEDEQANLWGTHFLCHEQLMCLYMQQQRWADSEEIGRHLIQAREKQISAEQPELDSYWDRATGKAARVIKIHWLKIVNLSDFEDGGLNWRVDKGVYYLHALYNDKRQLATAYIQLKKYSEAQRLLEELMVDKMHVENPILVASKDLLVTVYIELGYFDKAENLGEKIVEEMTERFGYDSKKLIPALELLADIYQKNKHLGKRHHLKLRLLRYR